MQTTHLRNHSGLRAFLIPLCVLLPVLGAFLGYQVGRLYLNARAQGRFVKWQHLPDPPQPADAIVIACANELQVQTAGGSYANLDVKHCLESELSSCWQPVRSADEGVSCLIDCGDMYPSELKVSAPPREYQEKVTVREWQECGAEWDNETQYIRTANGQIWVWQWENSFMDMPGPFLAIYCISVILGCVAGVILAINLYNKLS